MEGKLTTVIRVEAEGVPLPAYERRCLRHADDLAAAGQVEEAVAQLRTLVHTVPDSNRGYLRLASLLRQRRRSGEAREVLETAVAQMPHCPVSREALAEICLEIGRYDDAIRQGRALLEMRPRSIQARDLLSTAYLHRGQYEKALRLSDEMIRLDPCEPAHHFKRGVVLQQLGILSGACQAFLRALEIAEEGEMSEACLAAIDLLERYQIRQIVLLATEDVLFRLQVIHDPAEAVLGRGYYLSDSALGALSSQLRNVPMESAPGWRHYRYH